MMPPAAVSLTTPAGRALLAALVDAASAAPEREAFSRWRPLFSSDRPFWLFALHTAIALAARLEAAAALEGVAARLRDGATPVFERLRWLESGQPFTAAGVEGMAEPHPFAWILDEPGLAPVLGMVLAAIRAPAAGGPWRGDLFTGLYQALVPRDLRHALGEVYTPPHLAAYALDRIGWRSGDDLLDPTCGSGVFLLEAVRQRLGSGVTDAAGLLRGLYGIDLNPLAVLTAKASLVVALAPVLDPARPVRLPVWQGDALIGCDAPVPRVSHLCGNPPWVKWSQLPPDYAAAIKPACAALGVFGDDRYVGGIETDVSAAVTFAALARWLKPGGRLAFYLTASLFTTASGQGFRRFALPEPLGRCRVLAVEDFKAQAPFAGASNHPALLLLEAGAPTVYPVPYRRHNADGTADDLLARPVPGMSDGPWLKGSAEQQALWSRLFGHGTAGPYRARKGVTTDRNGIYFVYATKTSQDCLIAIRNDPALGRGRAVPHFSAEIEATHLFPLLRGRGLAPFRAEPDPKLRLIVPQRGMHGDPELAHHCPRTHAWFSRFESELIARGSYRRYQQGQPFWLTWSTGPYSFSPWKVLWREIASRFCAAYLGPHDDPVLGRRVVVPDHKLYFVPVTTEEEAAYLTGLLNAPVVVEAVTACAAALNLGTGVIETLRIPRFESGHPRHREMAARAIALTRGGGKPEADDLAALDRLALTLFDAL